MKEIFIVNLYLIVNVQDTVDMIIVVITVTIITHISKIYVERILPPIPNGITNIMLASINNSTLPEESAIILRIEPAFILAVAPATTGML